VITSSTSYLDTSTVSGVTYTYTVHARDAAGNESVASNAATINTGSTTSGGGKGGKPR
jgi:chitodextrinase